MSKDKELPIAHIRHCLDGATRDNMWYKYLITACDRIEEKDEQIKAHEEAHEDVRRLTKALDDVLCGDGAAERPMLCDVIKTAEDVMRQIKAKDEAIKYAMDGILSASAYDKLEQALKGE